MPDVLGLIEGLGSALNALKDREFQEDALVKAAYGEVKNAQEALTAAQQLAQNLADLSAAKVTEAELASREDEMRALDQALALQPELEGLDSAMSQQKSVASQCEQLALEIQTTQLTLGEETARLHDKKQALEALLAIEKQNHLALSKEKVVCLTRDIEAYKAIDAARAEIDRENRALVEVSELERLVEAQSQSLNEDFGPYAEILSLSEAQLNAAVNAGQEVVSGLRQLGVEADARAKALARMQRQASKLEQGLAGLAVGAEGAQAAERAAGEAQSQWLRAKQRYHLDQAASLAALLEPGAPCPVCGSAVHPAPAVLSETEGAQHLDLQGLEALDDAYQKAQNQLLDQQSRLQSQRKQWLENCEALHADVMAHQGQQLALPEASSDLIAFEEALNAVKVALLVLEKEVNDTLNAQKEDLALANEQLEIGKAHIRIKSDYTARAEALKEKAQEIAHTAQRHLDKRGVYESQVAEIVVRLTSQAHSKDSQDAQAQLRGLKAEIEDFEQRVAMQREGCLVCEGNVQRFTEALTFRVAQHSKLEQERTALQSRITASLERLCMSESEARTGLRTQKAYEQDREAHKQYTAQKAANIALLEHLTAQVKGRAPQPLEPLEEAIARAESKRDLAVASQQALGVIVDNYRWAELTLSQHQNTFKDRDQLYRVVGGLSNVVKGKNSKNISLERYVLTYYMDAILTRANDRLQQLTENRYWMLRRDEADRRNKQAGLELAVYDMYTGTERHVKTLSGGETFKASLALALGLAEVVEQFAGGVRLDTLLIDEGFGTLDPDSLDAAVNCLSQLRATGRLVGIISHVPELKERIGAQIRVTSGINGSSIALEMC